MNERFEILFFAAYFTGMFLALIATSFMAFILHKLRKEKSLVKVVTKRLFWLFVFYAGFLLCNALFAATWATGDKYDPFLYLIATISLFGIPTCIVGLIFDSYKG